MEMGRSPRFSRRRSPLANGRFWVATAVLLGIVAWHDYGPRLASQAVAQVESSAPADDPDVTVEERSGDAEASHDADADRDHGHSEPVAPVLAAIVLILFLAKVGGDLFERLHLPAVLGELSLGVLIGNSVFLTGFHFFDFMQPPVVGVENIDPGISVGEALQILAGIGVVLLLFEVGLESTVSQMFAVGASSVAVALLGVIIPLALGFAICRIFFFDNWQVPAFIGATLCATSVGITARVLKDLERSRDKESRIILGAAVIDDVLALILLAVVAGVIRAADRTGGTGGLPWGDIAATIAWALAFLGGALVLGALGVPKVLFKLIGYLHGHGLLVATALMICFGMAYLANLVGLAPIVGAFAAGLILEDAHYKDLATRENVELEKSLHPLTALLVPIFFVLTGMGVKLEAMGDPSTWILAGVLIAIAIIGKQACSLGVFEKGLNRIAVGLGMIPRGEVGLIFADQGRKLMSGGKPVIDDATFSAIVMMVMVTTLLTPPVLKWSLNRGRPREPAS